jgi:hypothetical protein
MCKRNTEVRSGNRCYRAVARTITYSDCGSVAFLYQHAKRMRRIILSSVAYLAIPYFYTLPHKRHDFRRDVFGHNLRVLIFVRLLYATLLILRRIKEILS